MRISDSSQAKLIPAIVFCTGACVLIIELLSTRMLAPYFGNTIFAFSTVIGVTLAALSVGYYYGGRLADARPYFSWFFAIILVSGTTVFLSSFLAQILLPLFGHNFSLVWGPLVFAIPLFALPCGLMGMLSPFAIRLMQTSASTDKAGSVAGTIYFWSTLGSIAGTFLTGFVLVPFLGARLILLSVGAFLLLLGLVGMVASTQSRRAFMLACTCAVLSVFFGFVLNLQQPGWVLYSEEGIYGTITVESGIKDGREIRLLRQNRNASSGIDPVTGELVFPYTFYYKIPLALRPELKHVLVLGAGAFTVPHAITKESAAIVEAVDTEPSLWGIAQRYFGVPDNGRIIPVVGDGRGYLRGKVGRYDLIFADAYQDYHSIPAHLITREFFLAARESLTPDGMFMGNFIGTLSDEKPSLLWSAARTFADVFPHASFFAVTSVDSDTKQNVMFLGCMSEKCSDPCAKIPAEKKTAFLAEACSKVVTADRAELAAYDLLIDDYVPVEYLAAKMF